VLLWFGEYSEAIFKVLVVPFWATADKIIVKSISPTTKMRRRMKMTTNKIAYDVFSALVIASLPNTNCESNNIWQTTLKLMITLRNEIKMEKLHHRQIVGVFFSVRSIS
jgi:hypothetical protein